MRLTFGKYSGRDVQDALVPLNYLAWLVEARAVRDPALDQQVRFEIMRRIGLRCEYPNLAKEIHELRARLGEAEARIRRARAALDNVK